jgi:hypothetical protein
VIIENISDRAQQIIDESNSSGYGSLHFEYVASDGQKKQIQKKPREWPKYMHTLTTLQPGEAIVRDIFLDDAIWTDLPVPKNKGANANVRLQAIFEQGPEPGTNAWQGRVTSAEESITFSNWR